MHCHVKRGISIGEKREGCPSILLCHVKRGIVLGKGEKGVPVFCFDLL